MPVTGPATFRPADPPREGVVEFSDERRTVALPIRAALPVLTRAHARDDVHPSVGLLGGAALLGMRLVAAGRFEPAQVGHSWRAGPLDADDVDRVEMLARSRSYDGLSGGEAETLVRQMLDAVSDAMPRSAPLATASRASTPSTPIGSGSPGATGKERGHEFEARLQARLARHLSTPDHDLAQLVRISLRVEADEEELVAGAVRVVLQVEDEQNPLHICDAAVLFTEAGPRPSHGFGERARTHASIALRAAAEAWAPLDRLLELRVPDEITLDTDELVSLLDHGVGALKERGVDVLWPRSLGRDLTATAVLDRAPSGKREEPLQKGLLSTDAMFAFKWQLALHGEPLTDDEMDQLANAAAPVLKLRGNWTVVDPAMAKKARKRLVRTVKPVQAIATALTGVVELEPADEWGVADETHVVVGASLLKVRAQLLAAATRD
ncbi:MAG: SNF2 helicase-associated domain-containing protein, partial [Nocardioides sp.]|nr:SNF2 helicase-associated domain-containing protein [Nocardioides sp.]